MHSIEEVQSSANWLRSWLNGREIHDMNTAVAAALQRGVRPLDYHWGIITDALGRDPSNQSLRTLDADIRAAMARR